MVNTLSPRVKKQTIKGEPAIMVEWLHVDRQLDFIWADLAEKSLLVAMSDDGRRERAALRAYWLCADLPADSPSGPRIDPTRPGTWGIAI